MEQAKPSLARPDASSGSEASGLVTAAYGRHLVVEVDGDDGPAWNAVARGRRADACVGDHVLLTLLGDRQAAIEEIKPRSNLLRRSDGGRSKSLAANLDQAAIVLSGDPPFSEELLMRVLAVAATEGIAPLIIAGKSDLLEPSEKIAPRLALYESLGYPVLRISARSQPDLALEAMGSVLSHRRTLLLGQSGMGKSTLINLLVPEAEMATQDISVALSSGRHTTTFCRMFRHGRNLPAQASLIDSPGFQLFGIAHLSRSQLMHALPDFRPLLGHCRFANCLHRGEPGCAVQEAVREGGIDHRRHQLYLKMLDETLD